MKFYGLLGRHLSHSYSKMIHGELGCAGYEYKELEPEELGEFVKNTNIGGINVTIPYKKDIVPYLDFISNEAREIGCVNSLI